MKLFLVPLLVVSCLPTRAQERAQLDGNPSLFTVMAAIHAAGFDDDASSPSNHPLRGKIREYIAQKNPPVLADIRKFYQNHRNATISNYVSLGLTLEGPPLFRIAKTMKEPPPDALLLEAMSPLLARLWSEADLDTVWKQAQPAYEEAIARRFHDRVSQEVLRANAFLRNPTSGYTGRRFQIYVELVAPPNQVHSRSFGDDYYVVVTPAPEPQIADIRRAYLYYLLDPLSLKYAKLVKDKNGLLQFAQPAPALDPHYKEDFHLLTTASLVRAVDIRLTNLNGNAKLQLVEQALREGFILTPFFYEQLPLYEKQDLSMRLYYPEMIQAIDLRREDKRLTSVQWAEAKATRTIRVTTEAKPSALTGPLRTLEEAEDLYNQKQYPKAKDKFSLVLRETDSRPLHAKAYFGLARISALDREFEMAEKLFEKTLELSPDAEVKSWTLVYLGRMLYSVNEIETAADRYKAALAVEGAPERARQAAQKGLQEATAKKQ